MIKLDQFRPDFKEMQMHREKLEPILKAENQYLSGK